MTYTDLKCPQRLRATRDALEAIQGKWRIPIIISLTYGNKRFSEIQKEIGDISPKMLSKELKELEINQLITRTVHDSMPVIVEYSLSSLGNSLQPLLEELLKWGIFFRHSITQNK